MDVGVSVRGHFEVHDVLDTVDIESARGDIGGHQHLVSSAAESADRREPQALGPIGMESRGLDAGAR